MRNLRFSIASLVVVVLFAGISFAALRQANETWDSGVFSVAVAVLLLSILLVIHRTERRRAFWIGFALFGWTYLGLSLIPPTESRLVTTKLLALMDAKILSMTNDGVGKVDYYMDGTWDIVFANESQTGVVINKPAILKFQDVTTTVGLNPAGKPVANGGWIAQYYSALGLGSSGRSSEHFVRIGHTFLALIAAIAGGQISGRLFVRR